MKLTPVRVENCEVYVVVYINTVEKSKVVLSREEEKREWECYL